MGLKRDWRMGLWFGFALGMSVDLIDPQNFGWMTFLMAITGCFAGVIKEKIFLDTIYYQTATIAVFTFAYQMLIRLVLWPGYFFNKFWYSLADSFLIAIYTSIIGITVLVLLKQRYRLKELL
jgi:cell shape-determining protein MreD